ncbi:MAG: hypothetical protein H6707_11180 [Deltaproteobacteria bacterium]|nr:hypothetical protein [Deltaproteobacteria bacterium]
MSAIFAIYRLDGQPIAPRSLTVAAAALGHRGSLARYCHGSLAMLGARIWHDRSGRRLVGELRIDNRRELLATLALADTTSDGALVLAAYQRWESDFARKLRGDFAFALYDHPQRRMVCVRDRFGVRPLVYHHRPGNSFICAAEVKGLLSLSEIEQRLDEERVLDFLVRHSDDRTRTFYRDITRLAPGHQLTVDRDGLRARSYYCLPDDDRATAGLQRGEDFAEAFNEVFRRAVARRIDQPGPYATALSGGLDSSSVTCIAGELLAARGAPLTPVSVVFPRVQRCDESHYIQAVRHHQRLTQGELIAGDQLSLLEAMERMFTVCDQPIEAINQFIYDAICRKAGQTGAAVLLDGVEGDATVSHGMARLSELLASGRLFTLGREVAALRRRGWHRSSRAVLRQAVLPFVPHSLRKLRAHWRGDTAEWDMLNSHSKARLGRIERFSLAPAQRDERAAHRAAIDNWGTGYRLEIADQLARASGLQAQHPFFDQDLVEFCLALPAEQKLSGGWTRSVMRRGLASALPLPIRTRAHKTSLVHNVRHTLLGRDRPRLEATLFGEEMPELSRFVDKTRLREAYLRYLSHGRTTDLIPVFKAVSLATWLRRTGL